MVAPATDSMLATSLAKIGAQLLSFLSCLAYRKQGMTVVTLEEAIAGIDHDKQLHEVVIDLPHSCSGRCTHPLLSCFPQSPLVSWLLNFLVTTLPRSRPNQSATGWDRSWCKLALNNPMLGMARLGGGLGSRAHGGHSRERKSAALLGRSGTWRNRSKKR